MLNDYVRSPQGFFQVNVKATAVASGLVGMIAEIPRPQPMKKNPQWSGLGNCIIVIVLPSWDLCFPRFFPALHGWNPGNSWDSGRLDELKETEAGGLHHLNFQKSIPVPESNTGPTEFLLNPWVDRSFGKHQQSAEYLEKFCFCLSKEVWMRNFRVTKF